MSDNGTGMNRKEFDTALQLASGNRSGATKGLGRYGMGLPNSSVSQTTRFEIYTKGQDGLLFNYVDLEEMARESTTMLQDIETVNEIEIPIIESGTYRWDGPRGTIVRWCKPNRIRPTTSRYLVEHLKKVLGRIFRYYIVGFEEDGKINNCQISIRVFDSVGDSFDENQFVTIKKLKPFDPLFLMKGTQMKEELTEIEEPTSNLFAESNQKVTVKNQELSVKILYSIVNPEIRKSQGRNAGETVFGKTYLRRNISGSSGYQNISIVRAKREIDFGNFGFIGDVSDNRNRWWSVEVQVEGGLDNILGIDNRKQQASQLRFFGDDETEDETNELLLWISENISANIKSMKKEIIAQSAGNGGGSNSDEDTNVGDFSNDTVDDVDISDGDETKEEREGLLNKWIEDRYPKKPKDERKRMVKWALELRQKFIIVFSDLGDTDLYRPTQIGDIVLLEVNFHHNFYKDFIEPYTLDDTAEGQIKRRIIYLLMCSLAKATLGFNTDDSRRACAQIQQHFQYISR